MQIRLSVKCSSSSRIKLHSRYISMPWHRGLSGKWVRSYNIYSCCSAHDPYIPPQPPRSCRPDSLSLYIRWVNVLWRPRSSTRRNLESVIRGVDGWIGFWVVSLVGGQCFNARFLGFGIVHFPSRLSTFRFTFVPFPPPELQDAYYQNTVPWHWQLLLYEVEHSQCGRAFIGGPVLFPALIHVRREHLDMLPRRVLRLYIWYPLSHSFAYWF